MIRLYFATDIHGSEKCWKKLLKAGKFYKANVVVLGGDMTGKAIVPIIKKPDGTYLSMFMEKEWVLRTQEELRKHEEQIQTTGLYIYHTDKEGYEELIADEKKREKLFLELTIQRIRRWIRMADEELKGSNIKYYVCPGNDDRFEIDPFIEESECVENAEGKVIHINNKYEMISTGWTNPTPWNTPRECSEEELAKKLENLISKVKNNATAIYAFHAPPYDSGLDYAPRIDEKLEIKHAGKELVPVGSTSVYNAIRNHQPLLGLHGHIHESKAICKIGKTLCINPGSMYDTGILTGVIINLEDGKVKSYLPVSG
jgi:Icc-related predicted phosphoesterase